MKQFHEPVDIDIDTYVDISIDPDINHHDNQLEYSRKVIKKYGSLVLKEDNSLDYLIYHGKNSRESWLLKSDNTVWQSLSCLYCIVSTDIVQ